MNQITLIGNVGKDDCELRFTPDGTPVASFTIATKTGFGDKEKTQWFRVTLWGKQAEKLTEYITRGKALIVFGEVTEVRVYTAKDGTPQASIEVRGEKVKFQAGTKDAGGNGAQAPAEQGEDSLIPF